jgi:predicted extracellular nuclease
MVTTPNATVFINEIHYDNVGTDIGEFIEIAGVAGTNLTGWRIVRYNGANGLVYTTPAATETLSGTIPNQSNGFGTVVINYPANGLQNGAPDAIALIDNNGTVIQFLSYEGSFTAVDGSAAGRTSTDIGVAETDTTPVGFSLQLVGSGNVYEDFTWSAPADDTPGSVNNGQTFAGGGNPTLSLSITPTTFSEAAGTNAATGTITRSGSNANALTVTLTSSDISEATVIATVEIPAGQDSATFSIAAIDDTITDGNQTVTITASATGFANAIASLTVTDDDLDPGSVRIHDIQGAAHRSPLTGQRVERVPGIVTAVDSNGFYLQDPNPDNDIATSEGIFVFTSSRPTVRVGDSILVTGTVSEFIPGGASTGNLSTTQIGGSLTISVLSSGNALPEAVILGAGGRIPPNQIIDNDPLSNFQPNEDGIDFYESLEGMRVTVNDALAVAPTNQFGEIFTVADNGTNATGLSDRGTINIAPDDFNPERIQIQTDSDILPGFQIPQVNVGAQLGDVTGVIGYNFGNFEVIVTEAFTPVAASTLQPEVTQLVGTANQLTIASFNVLNLDPRVEDVNRVSGNTLAQRQSNVDDDLGDGQFARLAAQIVNNLRSPDILTVQEVQDNDGAELSDVVDASLTYQTLIDAIVAAGGPRYEFRDIPPDDDQSGGQPGGNIRVGFLFNPERVDFVEGSLERVSDPNLADGNAFANSRIPLAGKFLFNGQEVTVIGNHFASKGGSAPLFGQTQPTVTNAPNSGQEDPNINGSLDQRRDQADAVKAYVDAILANDPNANILVGGDFNEFEFISPLNTLEQSLNNLTETLPENERYSFIFDGNSQALDHILVSDNLLPSAEYDIVHVNSEFVQKASDHDPVLTRLRLNVPQGVIWGTNQANTLNGTLRADTIYGRGGNDTINAFLGDDVVFAGTGNDGVSGFLGDDTLYGDAGNDTLDGGLGNDFIEGGIGNDSLDGGLGQDTLLGQGGNDRIFGGLGNDLIDGGSGNDTITGGLGDDRFVLTVGAGTDTITDFLDRQDKLALTGGLVFDDLAITQGTGTNSRDTLISLATTGELLAILSNERANNITAVDFVTL